jgi:hypothetical protein
MLSSHTARERSRTFAENVSQGEQGYPGMFFYPSSAWAIGFITTVLVIGVSGAIYLWFDRPINNPEPFSTAGIVYAVIGTGFFIAALIGYYLRRRSRKRAVGQLNAALNWHVFLAIIALAMLTFHAFGHFAAISGTYALIGLIVLVISGLVGRWLDRVLPRMITAEVDIVLTTQGEDRGESISQELQAFMRERGRGVPGVRSPHAAREPDMPAALNVPWDLAYISLEPTQQELDRDAPHYRFIPDRKSKLSHMDLLLPSSTEESLAEIREIRRAMRREQHYRALLRWWRVIHVSLAVTAVGLVIWHLVFVSMLYLPELLTRMPH